MPLRPLTRALTAVVLTSACLVAASSAGSAGDAPPRHAVATADAAATVRSSSWTAGGLIDTSTAAPSPAVAPSGFAQVGGCTFYASSASAGGYCSSGGGSAIQAPTLAAWLHGRTFYPCRFFPVPDGMVINAPSPNGGRWMLKACFTGFDLNRPWGGPDIHVEIAAQWVKDNEETRVPGDEYMDDFWSIQSDRNYYPLPRINYAPSTPFRVGNYSFFWATWVKALNSTKEARPEYRIPYNTTTQGTVWLHAKVENVRLYSGVEGSEPIDCGVANDAFDPNAHDAIPRSEGGDQESDCWTVFEHSTATEDRLTVQMRGQATWRVTVEDGSGQVLANLGDFSYTVTQRLAVGEVQNLVDW